MWTWSFYGLVTLVIAGCGDASSAGSPPSQPAPAQDEAAQAPKQPLDPSEEMMPVEAGPFLFGSSQEQFLFYLRQSRLRYPGMEDRLRERLVMPQQEKVTEAFWIDPFETTNEQFLEFLQQTGYRPQDPQDFLKHWEGTSSPPEWALTFPVVWVSVEDAEAFCAWRGARLPSEEEWEKAARGPEGLYFPWGDKGPDKDTAAWGNLERPEPVGNRPGDVSPYQVYDMGGNVAEWTSSIANFRGVAHRVVRGGAFNELAREMVTYQRRLLAVPAPRSEIIGFRCAFSR
ncbi:MAG TPA: SUMF1/EgtB/PvdO family nonheme iron enzyme [Acidobacteriota bacterium]|nr:SUMF1/EgtB/PvdO family nonheme iron enzyme [Acidobacteriota bacterium]